MTDSAAIVALITLIVTTAGGILTQLIAMRKTERAAKAAIAQTRADAALLAAQAKLDAAALSEKADRNKEELRTVARQGAELRSLVKENTALTEDGAQAAQNAFNEANQVNKWRREVNDDIKKLAESVQKILIAQGK